ncbi:glutamine-hydrolyzing GMP synthase [Candidatus Mycoplasma pogonae]
MNKEAVILDFGSQYTQVLARRIRELNVYVEVVPFDTTAEKLRNQYPDLKAIILSGGPSSVYMQNHYKIDSEILNLNLPILGICYGMQIITELMGGKVELADVQEFGKARLKLESKQNNLLKNIPDNSIVWMSHADHVTVLPENFETLAISDNSIAVIENIEKQLYGIQFHPEVTHSEYGAKILSNFLFEIANCLKNWSMANFTQNKITEIQKTVGKNHVILALSGGVDSSVAATLIQKAIGDQLTCIFVDTGLLRKNEAKKVLEIYSKNFSINLKLVNAQERFFKGLQGVTEPEEKRKIMGKIFVNIFQEESQKITNAKFLAQGTIYPDVIESSSTGEASKVIKSHHNVGGLPKNLKLELLEPLRELFKDEVRQLGLELGLPYDVVYRHPFPGPGLAIRIIGEVTSEKAEILKEVDALFINKLHNEKLYHHVSQAFAVLLPVKTVGVMGDNRTYENVVALRCVNTIDFMTAQSTNLPWEFLNSLSNEIINKVQKVNRVVYDITSKPPGTIEWE